MHTSRWILAGIALGFTLAVVPSCGPASRTCTPSSCPSGCCTAEGRCELGTLSTACGISGALCQVCRPTELCQGGICNAVGGNQNKDAGNNTEDDGGVVKDPDGGTSSGDAGATCNSSNCTGCCAGTTCIPVGSTNDLTCGINGSGCTTCASPFTCDTSAGVCVDNTCSGCVQGATCLTGNSNSACGTGGVACTACGSGQSCSNGQCVGGPSCDSTTCPNGCCQGGQCLSGDSVSACGTNGQACGTCASGQTCTGGTCVGGSGCGPSNCSGCCSSGICLPGTSLVNCGTGGQACATCNSQQVCEPQTIGGQCELRDAGVPATFGSACGVDADCAALGSGAICKKTTSLGSGTYVNGYCTLICDEQADCGASALCVGFSPDTYGEGDAICWPRCSSTMPCRTDTDTSGNPAYACYTVGNDQACWISPLPTYTGPAWTVGNACTSSSQCTPPSNGNCLDEVNTGFPGGMCSADCIANPAICGSNGVCLCGDQTCTSAYCVGGCATPNTRSTCRSQYTCYELSSGNGMCYPDCTVLGCPADAGVTCDTASGHCL